MIIKTFTISLMIVLAVLILGCKSDKLSKVQTEDLIHKGKEIASNTFAALSSELQKAMTDGGVPNAVKYCNLEALPITDSLSTKYNAVIRRASDKYRNPNNKANEQELNIIQSYQQSIRSGKQLNPQIVTNGEESTFYSPILTNHLCLKCHGNKNDIANYDIIADLYPDDLATGYKSGQIRGIWSIKFLGEMKK